MNNKNKKGFTLVELIAVVVILIIVLLLALNSVRNHTENAKLKALKANAISYVKAGNILSTNLRGTSTELLYGKYTVEDLENLGISISGTKPTSGYVTFKDYDINCACLQYDKSIATFDGNDYETDIKGNCSKLDMCRVLNREVTTFEYTGNYAIFTAKDSGMYKIEVWGASGGRALCNGSLCGTPGNGGYASGNIYLSLGEKLYVYVGEKGRNAVLYTNVVGSFNGGGSATHDNNDNESAGAGGGATDVRLVPGDWDNAESLASRIIVAGGGGGSSWDKTAGVGGGINGGDNAAGGALGATQTTGYAFGIGKNGVGAGNSDGVAGGGGGYWGGLSYDNSSGECASGGSGYVSGHTGCVAIQSPSNIAPKTGCDNGTTDKECSIHYSEKYFSDTVLLDGNTLVPTYDGFFVSMGNSGNGYAKITFLGDSDSEEVKSEQNFYSAFAGYQKLEYLESDGSQYIRTSIFPTKDTGIDVTFKSLDTYASTDDYFSVISSGTNSSNRFVFGTHYNTNTPSIYIAKSSSTYNYNQDVSNKLNVKIFNNSVFINGDCMGYLNTNSMSIDKKLTIFAYDKYGSIDSYSKMRLYDLYVYEKSDIVAHFIPCVRLTDNKPGLCETFSSEFLTNIGTGEFSMGSTLNE